MSNLPPAPPIPPDIEFWLCAMPPMLAVLIRFALANPHTKPDHVLAIADGLDEAAAQSTKPAEFIRAYRNCATALRDFAPRFDSPRLEQEVHDALFTR